MFEQEENKIRLKEILLNTDKLDLCYATLTTYADNEKMDVETANLIRDLAEQLKHISSDIAEKTEETLDNLELNSGLAK